MSEDADTSVDAGREQAASVTGAAAPPESGEPGLLESGKIEIVGQVVNSSNETFLVRLDRGDESGFAIYKPELGEAPLRDFPSGLYRRERAAYLLSESLGWGIVPLTVIREDAPFGVGSLQRFVHANEYDHYFTLYQDAPELHDEFRRLAVFDFVTNNTDRKSGHVLREPGGKIWAIDHGLCFSVAFKLRTVIWEFAGEPIPQDLVEAVADLIDDVPPEIAAMLSEPEVRALRGRARYILAARELPSDPTGWRYPWPLV